MPVAALFGIGAFDQRTACRFGAVRRRQPGPGQMVAALIVFAFAEEGGTAFLVDEPRRGVRKAAVGVGRSLATLGLAEPRPARPAPREAVVGPGAGRDTRARVGGFKVG